MSEKKRAKRRKDEYTGPGGADQEVDKPTKDEVAVAKWLRSNIPKKTTKFLSHTVDCFIASKALDALMSSKYAAGDNCLLPSREAAIEFLDSMLIHKFFHRAKKIPVTEQELKAKIKNKGGDKSESETKLTKKESATGASKKDTEEKEKVTDAESSHVEGGKGEKAAAEKEKRKRKIRLDMHPEQVFVDGAEVYVWIYDPIPMHYWLFGALLVVGAIVICLFPLWPPSLRKGVYYLSIAAAGFLVFILGLAVLRFVVFCLVWLVTGSKHHFWLFPNLTEDVGFFASFWPLYTHEYKDGSSLNKKTKKRKRDKDSDAEDDTNTLDKDKIDNIKENETGTISDRGDDAIEDASTSTASTVHKRNVTKLMSADDVQNVKSELPDEITTATTTTTTTIITTTITSERKDSITPSESESEGSQRSSTGKDFEMVDPADVDNP